jgi:hypothetical protein
MLWSLAARRLRQTCDCGAETSGLATWRTIGLCCSVSNTTAEMPARAGAGGLIVSLVAAAGPAGAAGENYDTALGFALALGFFLSFLFYIIPALVAWDRRHPDVRWIWALTLLLGWTGIGWFAALIWALRTTGANRGHAHARPADPA